MIKNNPKIALVHDYIKEYGGAERVLETLHEMYPQAPVYTLVYAPKFLGPHKQRFAGWKINQSFLQYIPFSYRFISLYRLVAPFVFKTFDFSGYDVVIVSATGAYNPNMIRKKSAVQICYCHTPPRYLYGYATAREMSKNFLVKAAVVLMNHFLRMIDFASSQNVDLFIANSENVAGRIKKFYRKDAMVVYPPVDISSGITDSRVKHENDKRKDYYLCGGRLARPKHIDLIIRACRRLNIKLKIFGKSFAGYGQELHLLAGNNIEFLGEVTDEEKLALMRNAKAFIFAAEDEDFGIVPVEAMGQGVPVIAYKSGGVMESVIEGKTGIFFAEQTEESLIQAIKKFEKTCLTAGRIKFSAEECKAQAEKFSKERFIRQIKKIIENQFLEK